MAKQAAVTKQVEAELPPPTLETKPAEEVKYVRLKRKETGWIVEVATVQAGRLTSIAEHYEWDVYPNAEKRLLDIAVEGGERF